MANTCSNCNEQLHGDFCSFCGQRNNTKRITTKQIATDIFNNLFNVDSPLWATLRLTLTAPGQLSRDFIGGKRKCYFHPVRYFVIAMAVYYLFVWMSDYNPVKVSFDIMGQGDKYAEDSQDMGMRVSNIIRKNVNLLMFVWIAWISIFDRWFYKKDPFNVAERSVHYFFALGTYTVIYSPFIAFHSFGISPDIARFACLAIFLPYTIMSFHQKLGVLNFLKALSLVIISFFIYVMTVSTTMLSILILLRELGL